jgi:hypothetical protein
VTRLLHLYFDPKHQHIWELTKAQPKRMELDARRITTDPYETLAEEFNDYAANQYFNVCGKWSSDGRWESAVGFAVFKESFVQDLDPCDSTRACIMRTAQWIQETIKSVLRRINEVEVKYCRTGQQEPGPEKWQEAAWFFDKTVVYAFAVSKGLELYYKCTGKALPRSIRRDNDDDSDVANAASVADTPAVQRFSASGRRLSNKKDAVRKYAYRHKQNEKRRREQEAVENEILGDSSDESDVPFELMTDKITDMLKFFIEKGTPKMKAYGFKKIVRAMKGRRKRRTT